MSFVHYLRTLTLFFVGIQWVQCGLIDPQIYSLIKEAGQPRNQYYVVSPVHYLPSYSFLSSFHPIFYPTASHNQNVNVAAENVDLTNEDQNSNDSLNPRSSDDTVSIESSDDVDSSLRQINPPELDFEDSSDADDVSKGSPEKSKSPPDNTYLPPKNTYLPPRRNMTANREYLPPKPVYGPPSTTESPPIYLATYIIKSYHEPGFSFNIPGASLPYFQTNYIGAPTNYYTLSTQEEQEIQAKSSNSNSTEQIDSSPESDKENNKETDLKDKDRDE